MWELLDQVVNTPPPPSYPSCNHVYFVYYYIDVCDSTLIGIVFSKT